MTHTSTEQPEALRLAENLEQTWCMNHEAEVMRRLHARVQELEAKVETGKRLLREEMERANRYAEASQAQRVPLSDERIDEIFNERGQNSNHLSGFIREIVRNTETEHGITQEKQG